MIIVDAGSVLDDANTIIFAKSIDKILLCSKIRKTNLNNLVSANKIINSIGEKLVGSVLLK